MIKDPHKRIYCANYVFFDDFCIFFGPPPAPAVLPLRPPAPSAVEKQFPVLSSQIAVAILRLPTREIWVPAFAGMTTFVQQLKR
jgi:hypothetical protein